MWWRGLMRLRPMFLVWRMWSFMSLSICDIYLLSSLSLMIVQLRCRLRQTSRSLIYCLQFCHTTCPDDPVASSMFIISPTHCHVHLLFISCLSLVHLISCWIGGDGLHYRHSIRSIREQHHHRHRIQGQMWEGSQNDPQNRKRNGESIFLVFSEEDKLYCWYVLASTL